MKPDQTIAHILELDLQALRIANISTIAFDADRTLGHFFFRQPEKNIEDFITQVSQDFGIILATNRRRPITFANLFGASIVQPVLGLKPKPHAEFFQRIIDTAGVPANKIAMVGDSMRKDIEPAQRSGMYTVWVDSRRSDAKHIV